MKKKSFRSNITKPQIYKYPPQTLQSLQKFNYLSRVQVPSKTKKKEKIKVAGFLKQNPPQTIPQTKNKLYHRVPSQRKRSMSKKHPFNVPLLPSKISQVVGRPFTKVTPRIYIKPLHTCSKWREGKEEAGQTSSAPPSRIRGRSGGRRESICN